MTGIAVTGAAAPRINRKQLAAVCMGNWLDFYDFLTFAFFAAQIGRTLFPNGGGNGLIYALLTFGAGFLTRPLGGILFGRIADRRGRVPAMLLSFSLMGVSIVGLALTPSYRTVGMVAPILAVTFRLLQGLALGGEVGPNSAFLYEAAPANRRALYVAMQAVTQNCGVMASGAVGAALSAWLTPAQLDSYGWRIAFLLGACIVPLTLWVRRTLVDAMPPEQAAPRALPKGSRAVIVGGFLALVGGTIGFYSVEYLGTYAQTVLDMPAENGFRAILMLGLAAAATDVVTATLMDRGMGGRWLVLPWAFSLVLIIPAFMVLADLRTPGALLAVTIFLGVLFEWAFVPMLVQFVGALPRHARATLLGGTYALAIAIFGGSAQPIINRLMVWTGNPISPAWYITLAVFVGLVGMVILVRHAAGPANGQAG